MIRSEARERRPSPSTISVDDLLRVEGGGARPQPDALPLEVDALCQRRLGRHFLSVMRHDPARQELERIYSSHPDEYPVGGRKGLIGAPWADPVVRRGEVMVASTSEDLLRQFSDHELLLRMGLGSAINSPILFQGRCIGALNLFHQSGWYRPADASFARVLSGLLIPFVLAPAPQVAECK